MKALPFVRVWLVSLIIGGLALTLPVRAQDDAIIVAKPWQDVITNQIQAFRDHDAPAAFSYAGLGFQATFPNAETFFIAIIQSGYVPIIESRSHSFREFKMIGDMGVVQQVRFIGNDQTLYDAVFQLTEEAGSWKVQGVHLMQPLGVAI